MKTPIQKPIRIITPALIAASISIAFNTNAQTTNTNSTPVSLGGYLRHGHPRTILTNLTRANVDALAPLPTAITGPSRPPDEIGPHYRKWRIVPAHASTNSPIGTVGRGGPAIVERATGMHYFDGQAWRASDPTIGLADDGTGAFVANHVQHKLRIESNLNVDGGAVSLTMPDGVLLRSTPLAIVLFDAKSGLSTTVATITNCTGVQVNSNEVAYPNAFAGPGVCAGLVYHLERGSCAQDLVFSGKFDPTAYGFPEATTRIQIISELFSSVVPEHTRHPIWVEQNQTVRQSMASPDFLDDTLSFGQAVMGPGRAWQGSTPTARGNASAPVGKQVQVIDGRTFLIESVQWTAVKPWILSLPDCQNSTGTQGARLYFQKARRQYAGIPRPSAINPRDLAKAAGKRIKPAREGEPDAKDRRSILLAQTAFRQQPGVTIDWMVTLAGDGQTVFESGVTTFVSGPVYCNSLLIEGGSVIKYPTSSGGYGAFIQVYGDVSLTTSPYSLATFTAGDDDSVGFTVGPSWDPLGGPVQPWSGYTGDTTSKLYAAPALYLSGPPANLNHLRFCYADHALTVDGAGAWAPPTSVAHSQFVNCLTGVSLTGSSTPIYINNCLFSAVNSPVEDQGDANQFYLCHCTVDSASQLVNEVGYNGPDSTVMCTNCILANVLDTGPSSDGDFNGFYPATGPAFGSDLFTTANWPFVSEGHGYHYLASNSGLKGVGTPNIDPALLSAFSNRCTQPPLSAPATIEVDGELTIFPQIQRYNGGQPDLGYYYPSLDITFAHVDVAGTVTALPGAAIGIRCDGYVGSGYTYVQLYFLGFDLWENSTFNCRGTPTRPVTIVGAEAVQEGPHLSYPDRAKDLIYINVDPILAFPDQPVAPPSFNERFCESYASQTDFHVWGSLPENEVMTGPNVKPSNSCSYNSWVSWVLQDSKLVCGGVNLASPWSYSDGTTDWLPDTPGSIVWLNSSFDRVNINLNPSDDLAPQHISMNFEGQNNLFRNSRLRIVPAAGCLWTMTDNLFEKETFYQDTSEPLNHHHNAYWPCSDSELIQHYDEFLSPNALLQADTGGTTDSATDKTLPAPPDYQVGPYGQFYFAPNSATFALLQNAGSQSPAAATLFHYTSRTDEVKDSTQAQVNIGLHYVAAGPNGLPTDYDADGIPDFVENWHGDGTWHQDTETSWLVPETVGGMQDSLSLVYDDSDVDGDGMAGRVERALGTAPLYADNPLVLHQVPSGKEPDVVFFEILYSYQSITNAGHLEFDVDGAPAKIYAVRPSTNGCLIKWNSTFEAPGPHALSVCLRLRAETPQSAPQPAVLAAAGPIILSPVTNILGFDTFFSSFFSDTYICADLAAGSASYSIKLYNPAAGPLSSPFRTITGSTTAGRITEYWDGTDDGGSQFTGSSMLVSVEVTSGDSPTETHSEMLDRRCTEEIVPDGNFAVAYTSDGSFDYDSGNSIFQNCVVDVLLNPYADASGALQGPAYGSSFNIPSSGGLGGYAGYLPDCNTVEHLLYDVLGPVAEPGNLDTRNFFFYGHGLPDWLGNVANSVQLTATDVAGALGNYYDDTTNTKKRQHRYRFVWLQACLTAEDSTWADAFDIAEEHLMWDYLQRPDGVQALVGWLGEDKMPASSDQYTSFSHTLYFIFSQWMDQKPLYFIVTQAQRTYPDNWPRALTFPLKGRYSTDRPFIRGFPGIKRTGLTTNY